MKIGKISYTEPNECEVSRWLERIIELSILEFLECTDKTKIELTASKFLNDQNH